MVVQGVGRRFDSYFDRRWEEGEVPHTQLVLIGQDLQESVLTEALQTACVHDAGKSPDSAAASLAVDHEAL